MKNERYREEEDSNPVPPAPKGKNKKKRLFCLGLKEPILVPDKARQAIVPKLCPLQAVTLTGIPVLQAQNQ